MFPSFDGNDIFFNNNLSYHAWFANSCLNQNKLFDENLIFSLLYYRLCLSEYDFEHSNLKEDWKITALSKSSKNKKFIASIESKKFPFFGIQFHPEKIAFDFYENEVHNENIPHSLMDILVNRYFYDILVEYGRKSNNTFNNTDEALASSIYNYRVTYDTEYNKFHPVYLF